MITYQVEPWALYYRDCQALWRMHYDEIAARKDRRAMSPDIPAYEALDAAGQLLIVVARSAGEMVGYQLSVARRHMHYDVFCGFEDAYFLHPGHRKGMAGVRLIREAREALKRRGCQEIFFHSTAQKPLDRLFQFLGFGLSHTVHSQWIGD